MLLLQSLLLCCLIYNPIQSSSCPAPNPKPKPNYNKTVEQRLWKRQKKVGRKKVAAGKRRATLCMYGVCWRFQVEVGERPQRRRRRRHSKGGDARIKYTEFARRGVTQWKVVSQTQGNLGTLFSNSSWRKLFIQLFVLYAVDLLSANFVYSKII